VTNFIVLFAVLIWIMGEKQEGHLQDFNVSGIQCRYIANNVTPQMVERDVNKYIDTCVQWAGRVARIADADPNFSEGKAWVVPIEGKYAYVGYTIMKIGLAQSSKIEEYSNYRSLDLCDCLYSHGDLDIRIGDFVSFTGRILGISKKPDPAHRGSSIERTLIGVTEIHKLRKETLKTPLLPG
jgi:hypothetical protein